MKERARDKMFEVVVPCGNERGEAVGLCLGRADHLAKQRVQRFKLLKAVGEAQGHERLAQGLVGEAGERLVEAGDPLLGLDPLVLERELKKG